MKKKQSKKLASSALVATSLPVKSEGNHHYLSGLTYVEYGKYQLAIRGMLINIVDRFSLLINIAILQNLLKQSKYPKMNQIQLSLS